MKTALISSILLLSATATPALAQDGDTSSPSKEPILLTEAKMDSVRAGALVNVNALNNVAAAVPVNAQVAVLSDDTTNNNDQTAETGAQDAVVTQF